MRIREASSAARAPACHAPREPPPWRKTPRGPGKASATAAGEEALIERFLRTDHAVDIELGSDRKGRGRVHAAAQALVLQEQREALGEGVDVSGLDQEAVVAVLEDVGDAVGGVTHGGQSRLEGFDQG